MNMDVITRRIVKEYVEEHLDKSDKDIKESDKQPYIVWKCKTLQNWKYLMSTDLHDGMYYELTWCVKNEMFHCISGETQYLVCLKCGKVKDTRFVEFE